MTLFITRLWFCWVILLAIGTAAFAQELEPTTTAKSPSLSEAREMLLTGSYKEAMAAFENLLREPKTKVPATLGLAEAKIRVGEYQEAIDLLEPLEARNSARHSYLLAQLCWITGQYGDA